MGHLHNDLTPYAPADVLPDIRIYIRQRLPDKDLPRGCVKWCRPKVWQYEVVFLCCGDIGTMTHENVQKRIRRRRGYCRACSNRRARGRDFTQRPVGREIEQYFQRLIDRYRDPLDGHARLVIHTSWPVPPLVLKENPKAWLR